MKGMKTSERGQAMVLMVLGVVVLLGFTALAIDGGRLYSDRRHAQSGADSASLAGAGAAGIDFLDNGITSDNWSNCAGSVPGAERTARIAAATQAAEFDYILDANLGNNPITDNHGVETDCGIDPQGGYIDVITYITRDSESAFAHLVYGGPLRTSVSAVTRVRPRTPPGFGNAIVATNTDCPSAIGGVTVGGTNDIYVCDGGIYSNACIDVSGTSGEIIVDNGDITCILRDGEEHCYDEGGSPAVTPGPTELNPEDGLVLDEFAFPTPDCDSLVDDHGVTIVTNGETEILSEGWHTSIRVNNLGDLTLGPGLHCVRNGINLEGGSITGSNVTIYVISGSVLMPGSPYVDLSAPPNEGCPTSICRPDYPGLAIPGLLFYLAEGNTNPLELMGESESTYQGTIYVPDGIVKLGGTADLGPDDPASINYWTQIIADTVRFEGTTTVNICYEPTDIYHDPAELDFHK